jgi:hypothetical protein
MLPAMVPFPKKNSDNGKFTMPGRWASTSDRLLCHGKGEVPAAAALERPGKNLPQTAQAG